MGAKERIRLQSPDNTFVKTKNTLYAAFSIAGLNLELELWLSLAEAVFRGGSSNPVVSQIVTDWC